MLRHARNAGKALKKLISFGGCYDCDFSLSFRCGEEGHISKDCEKGFVTQKKTKEDGQVVEYYVPAEADEDKLFAAGITQGINFDKYDKIEVSFNEPRVGFRVLY